MQVSIEVHFDDELISHLEVHVEGLLDDDGRVCEGLREDVVPDVAVRQGEHHQQQQNSSNHVFVWISELL